LGRDGGSSEKVWFNKTKGEGKKGGERKTSPARNRQQLTNRIQQRGIIPFAGADQGKTAKTIRSPLDGE